MSKASQRSRSQNHVADMSQPPEKRREKQKARQKGKRKGRIAQMNHASGGRKAKMQRQGENRHHRDR